MQEPLYYITYECGRLTSYRKQVYYGQECFSARKAVFVWHRSGRRSLRTRCHRCFHTTENTTHAVDSRLSKRLHTYRRSRKTTQVYLLITKLLITTSDLYLRRTTRGYAPRWGTAKVWKYQPRRPLWGENAAQKSIDYRNCEKHITSRFSIDWLYRTKRSEAATVPTLLKVRWNIVFDGTILPCGSQ